jgi:hypothetical protein
MSITFDDSWFFNASIWNTKHESSKNENEWMLMIKKHKYELGSPIGEDSTYGKVYPFEPTVRSSTMPCYVLKRVEITDFSGKKNPHLFIRLIQEAIFGETFVDAPIPIVIAHRYNHRLKSYEMLMQNILTTTTEQKLYKSESLLQYTDRHQPKQLSNVDMKLIHNTIVDFYKKTKYFHGDLHLKNIMVTFKKANPTRIVRVFVIDFGSSMPFLKTDWERIDQVTHLHQFMPIISRAFKKLSNREDYNPQTRRGGVSQSYGLSVLGTTVKIFD